VEHLGTILVVDDQPSLRESLTLTLKAGGHRVLAAEDGFTALDVLQAQTVDLIMADVAMPGMNGYQLFERVRQNPPWVPIPFIFLTARSLDSDIRYGKELGVDDYLTKPIQPEDLLAAVNGRLRRARQMARVAGQQGPQPQLSKSSERAYLVAGRFRVDHGQHRAWFDGQPLKLSAREFVLLEHLVQQAGIVFAPQDLIQVTHGLSLDATEAGVLLRPLIRTLRRKLGHPTGEPGCIENVRGVGYRLIAAEASVVVQYET
jgi:DNA-binding response OmpR family regulator